MSKTSNLSRPMSGVHKAPSVASEVPSAMSIDEADEWTAILKFNSLLHYEEQKQSAAR